MTTDVQSAREDLAFLRALVDSDERIQTAFAAGYMSAGLLWGVQVLLQWADFAGLVDFGRWGGLAVITVPTAVLLALWTWLGRRTRASSTDPASRALGAAFNGAALATGAIFAVFIVLAIRMQSGVLWLIYAPVIFAIQGGAWFVAYRLRRRRWLLAVALGWLASAVGLGFAAADLSINVYIGILVLDLFLLMALPGAVMLHLAQRSAP